MELKETERTPKMCIIISCILFVSEARGQDCLSWAKIKTFAETGRRLFPCIFQSSSAFLGSCHPLSSSGNPMELPSSHFPLDAPAPLSDEIYTEPPVTFPCWSSAVLHLQCLFCQIKNITRSGVQDVNMGRGPCSVSHNGVIPGAGIGTPS